MTCQPGRSRVLGLVAGLVLLPAAHAAAQVDPSSPFRSPLEAAGATGQRAVLSVSLFEGYDSTTQRGTFDTSGAPIVRGAYSVLAPDLQWQVGGRRTSLGLTARTALRYATDIGEVETLDRAGSIGLRTEFGRTAIQADGTVTYRPYYEYTGLPGGASGGLGQLPELRLSEYTVNRPMLVSRSAVGVSRQVGRYLWLRAAYAYGYSRLESSPESDIQDVVQTTHDGHVSLIRQIGRRTRVQFGYGMRSLRSKYPLHVPIRTHQIDIGVLHGQRFALGRDTLLTLSGGPAVVESTDGSQVAALGEVKLERRFSRGWSAFIDGRRSISYAEGFPEPLLSRSVSASLDGAFGRRMRLNAYYGYSRGDTSLGATLPTNIETRSGTVRLTTQVLRGLGVYLEYVTFYQSTIRDIHSALDVNGTWDRQGLRAGIVWAVPIGAQRGVE